MSLDLYSKEQLQEMSLIEIAYEYLKNNKQAISFNELMSEIAEARELTDEQVRAIIAQFYTDLNIDGRFLTLGQNRWGLRVWYPVDTIEEEVATAVKPKKKKAKKVVDEEAELDDYDEVEEDYDFDDTEDFVDEDELLDDEEEESFDELDEVDEFEEEEEFDLDEDLDEDLGDTELDELDENEEPAEDDEEDL